MNKRRRIVFLGFAGAMLVVAVWYALPPREPVYQGKKLSEWLRRTDSWLCLKQTRLLSDEASVTQQMQQVTLALREMGSSALPHLIQKLTHNEKPTPLRRATEWINERQKFLEIPLHDRLPWSTFAAEAFRLLGTNAEPAIPKLEKLLLEDQTSFIAADCLFSIGSTSVPTFVRALTNRSERVRIISLQALGDFGPLAWEAIPFIAEMAQGTNATSYNALRVLCEVDTNRLQYLALFESRLFDTNYPLEAAFALGRMGTDGMPLLLRALTNQSKHVRVGALSALHPTVREFSPGQANRPHDYSFRRICTAFNLATMSASWALYQNQEARLAIPALTRVLSHPDATVQMEALQQLRQYGLAGVVGLSFAAEETNPLVRQAVAATLDELGVQVQGGAIIRGRKHKKRVAVVFTGHSYAEGGETIMNELAKLGTKGSFFLTGDFLTNKGFMPLVQRVVKEGHYLGPHSDKHLLYCSWDATRKTLVTRQEFMSDMAANLQRIENVRMTSSGRVTSHLEIGGSEMQLFGINRRQVCYLLPPYEHHNGDIALWALDMGLTLINFTPGTRSNADYTGEADPNFVSSQVIFDSIVKKEREDPHGLNGCILLFHLGSGPGRKDKFHHRFGELLDYLAGKGYQFVRVDELLEPKPEVTPSSKSPQSPTEARPGDGR